MKKPYENPREIDLDMITNNPYFRSLEEEDLEDVLRWMDYNSYSSLEGNTIKDKQTNLRLMWKSRPNLSIDYVKNNKVAIHVTSSEEVKKCDELLGWCHNYKYDNRDEEYYIGTQNGWDSDNKYYKGNGYQTIEAKDFINYNTKNMEKKIIGYKLKESCKEYAEAACKIEGYKSIGEFIRDCKVIKLNEDYATDRVAGFEKLRKAGVLELWFDKVYVDEFKVGDWVVVNSVNQGGSGNGIWTNNLISQLYPVGYQGASGKLPYEASFSAKGNTSYYNISLSDIQRLATETEIKDATKKTIVFGDTEWTIESPFAESKHGRISKGHIKEIIDHFEKKITVLGHDLQVVNEGKWYIKVGCQKGTLSQIKAMYELFD